ncbi:MAG: HAD family hydrolase [Bacteroidales bacterium]|nr:HAD family hydrolase [Bacteroidales bacterium]MCF8402391.1 HAD family hydrolase [Bacteroidales bacterium]
MNLRSLTIDKSWALFLDRDGVINKKLPDDYVKNWGEFEFLNGVPKAILMLNDIFGKILIVTNQQGIGKGIMSETDLAVLHNKLLEELRYEGARINKIYHSPYRNEEKSVFRKPNIGMARKAKIDFPDIKFKKSIMVGDSISDMQFGKNAGMYTVFITNNKVVDESFLELIDFTYSSLKELADHLTEIFKA